MEKRVYRCSFESSSHIDWNRIAAVELTNTVNGDAPRLNTVVKMCRSEQFVHIRFECEDDHIVATYTNRDDPIYKEDVVEVFVDEKGAGTHYKEYEFSPRNVVFDALIEKEAGKRPIVNISWNDSELQSEVIAVEPNKLVYDIRLSLRSFERLPVPGTSWRINFYRIDQDAQGKRHFWAWSPTGIVNYHTPEKFGTVIFE